MAELELRDVTKTFGRVTAVRDVTLKVEEGEFVVLVGPSGCGKTTTLRMVAGLEAPSHGDILIGGKRVNNVPAKDRNVAMVFQSYALYPHLTVWDNMAFGLRLRRVPVDEIRNRVARAAEMLGITDLLNRWPRELSGGQRQRVALGRAIVREPALFLMDEPLSNLDAKLRVVMRSELKRLQRDLGVTTIYVTHDQTEAMTLGDRVVVMDQGVVQQVGAPREVYCRPANVFVASFIGSPPMNLFEARARSEGGSLLLDCGSFVVKLRGAQPVFPTQVTVGVRPEAVRVADGESQNDVQAATLSGHVVLVESLGSDTIVHVGAGQSSLVVKVPGDAAVVPGDFIRLVIPVDAVHVFDSATGRRIETAGTEVTPSRGV